MTLNNKLTTILLTLSTVLISSCGTTSQEDISILEQANNAYSQEKKVTSQGTEFISNDTYTFNKQENVTSSTSGGGISFGIS
ncbi:hypothetical protein [Francisella hispaniensis]|uniref:hypothetical protein n=1 Tax=Francisella hispaniensis TaxID=622488 RepID=UPI00190734B3|nr:hypothetical protein [Francisella hispaniensis]MBK2356122.1 hypothetical protein [Francisella hispaniensis]